MHRRATGANEEMKRMTDEIYKCYAAKKEPGTYQGKDHLRWTAQAGEPTTPERSRLWKQCNHHGPIGLLSETIHLHASSLDESWNIVQWDQPPVSLTETPYQHLRPLLRQAAARNPTIAAEGMMRAYAAAKAAARIWEPMDLQTCGFRGRLAEKRCFIPWCQAFVCGVHVCRNEGFTKIACPNCFMSDPVSSNRSSSSGDEPCRDPSWHGWCCHSCGRQR